MKKWNNGKLKGFTLVEMLVSMALMGTVLLLGIFTYKTFLSYHQKHASSLERASELSLLSYILNQDIQTSIQVFLASSNSLGLVDAREQTQAIYECFPGKIIRNTPQRQDTFAIAAQWISKADGSIALQDSALLWQIPIRLWPQAKGAMTNKFPQAVDLWFERGTNDDSTEP